MTKTLTVNWGRESGPEPLNSAQRRGARAEILQQAREGHKDGIAAKTCRAIGLAKAECTKA
jgi:hypothetical protein